MTVIVAVPLADLPVVSVAVRCRDRTSFLPCCYRSLNVDASKVALVLVSLLTLPSGLTLHL